MAFTFIAVPAGGSVQLDDGTHAFVYIQNAGSNDCVVEPEGATLRAGRLGNFAVTPGQPLTVLSNLGTTVAFQVSDALAPASSTAAASSAASAAVAVAIVFGA